MTRLKALSPDEAKGRTKELFDAIQGKLGTVPNMMKTMGNSSAVLEGYLQLSDALSKGTLGAKTGELIAMAVAESNTCNYCLSAHSFIGEHLLKMDAGSIHLARKGESDVDKVQAALTFSKTLVSKMGMVSDSDVQAVKAAGYTDGEIGEIIAHAALNIFTNYFNNVAITEIDFPVVKAA